MGFGSTNTQPSAANAHVTAVKDSSCVREETMPSRGTNRWRADAALASVLFAPARCR
jgi:hypothetical protein